MILLIIFLTGLLVAVGAGVLASFSDARGLTISNSYSAAIGIAFIVCFVLLALGGHENVFYSFSSHFLGALIVFGVTAALFSFGIIGAADSKLATVYALWMSLHGLFAFLFYMSLAGGLLGLLTLYLRKFKPLQKVKAGTWIARAQAGENKVPYGIAIFAGALASFVKLGYFDTETLRSFVLS